MITRPGGVSGTGYSGGVLVRTATVIGWPVGDVWPMLCGFRITLKLRCPVFHLGVPRSVECRLPDGEGREGAARQCVSAQGSIEQQITDWAPPARLAFRMQRTDLAFARCVSGLSDEFELRRHGGGEATRLARATRVEITGRFRCVKQAAVYIGLKAVHRHVFRAWRRPPATAPPTAPSTMPATAPPASPATALPAALPTALPTAPATAPPASPATRPPAAPPAPPVPTHR